MPRTPRLRTKPNDETHRKSSNVEISRRVTIVLGWLVAGKSRAAIVQDGSSRWNVSERQVDDYLAVARKRLDEKTERDREALVHLAVERMNMVFDDAYDEGDYKSAIGAQREINKIVGAYAPTKQDVNVSGTLTWAQMIQQAQEDADDNGDS